MAQKKNYSAYAVGSGMIDTVADDLQEIEATPCGPLEDAMQAAVDAIEACKHEQWDAQDQLIDALAAPFPMALQARLATAAEHGRPDDEAKGQLKSYMDNAISEIGKVVDVSLGQKACDAVKAFGDQLEFENTKALLPSGLTQKMDLDKHAQRIEKTRSLEAVGAVVGLSYYRVLMKEGSLDDVLDYESAAENYMQSIASGGTKRLVAEARRNLSVGQAADEVEAANVFNSLLQANRQARVPAWLAAARGAYGRLVAIVGKVAGEDIQWMSATRVASIYDGAATGALPNALDCQGDWVTRHMTKGVPLSGWSPIEFRGKGGIVKRSAGASPATPRPSYGLIGV